MLRPRGRNTGSRLKVHLGDVGLQDSLNWSLGGLCGPHSVGYDGVWVQSGEPVRVETCMLSCFTEATA